MKYMERKKNNDDEDKNNNDKNDNDNDADKNNSSSVIISTKRMSILDIPDGNAIRSNYGDDLYSTYPLTSSSSSSSSRINGKTNESSPKSSSTLNLESNTAVRNNDIIRTSQRNVDIYNFLKLIIYDEYVDVNNIQQQQKLEGRHNITSDTLKLLSSVLTYYFVALIVIAIHFQKILLIDDDDDVLYCW